MADKIIDMGDVAEDLATDEFMNLPELPEMPNDMKMPSVEEVWKLIEQMDGISEEERADIRKNLFNPSEGSAEDFLKRLGRPPAPTHTTWDYVIFLTMITLILLVFAFFGIRLYRYLKSKEVKKQRKSKEKQSKRSKKTQ